MNKTEIDYEKLVKTYENSLMTTLRGHSPHDEYLATWVPDADPVNGILNMIEAAEIGGCNQNMNQFGENSWSQPPPHKSVPQEDDG